MFILRESSQGTFLPLKIISEHLPSTKETLGIAARNSAFGTKQIPSIETIICYQTKSIIILLLGGRDQMPINMNYGMLLVAIVILMITLGGSGCASTSYTVPKTVVDDASLLRIEINGVLLHSRTFGNPNRPVVIVLHGGPGWDSRYLLPIQALKDEFFVVFYDQRGAGLSQRVPDEQLTYKVMMEDRDAVVDHYGKGRKVSLIGHSWGAMLASLYLAQYPDKLAGVVIAASGPMTGEIADRLKWPFSIGFVFHAGWNWFGSRFVHEPDEYATDDYFYYRLFATYEGPGHPLA